MNQEITTSSPELAEYRQYSDFGTALYWDSPEGSDLPFSRLVSNLRELALTSWQLHLIFDLPEDIIPLNDQIIALRRPRFRFARVSSDWDHLEKVWDYSGSFESKFFLILNDQDRDLESRTHEIARHIRKIPNMFKTANYCRYVKNIVCEEKMADIFFSLGADGEALTISAGKPSWPDLEKLLEKSGMGVRIFE